MVYLRVNLSLIRCTQLFNNVLSRHGKMDFTNTRSFSVLEISKNLELIHQDTNKLKVIDFKLSQQQTKPLVVLLSWMLAKRKHIYKFADFYVENGFDVLRISISPWQLFWPTKGTQIVANEVVQFLDVNVNYNQLLVHGFSVGGYQWGEVLVNISNNQKRYQHILDRIVGQIWDSAADISEVSFGFPMAVFPKNLILQNAMKQYLLYHMRVFDKVATCHYIRSSQIFHSNLVKAPALFLLSRSDPVGAEKSNLRLKEDWENLGIKVFWQCWDKSPHVSHYQYHRQEYLSTLNMFLNYIGLLANRAQIQAKL